MSPTIRSKGGLPLMVGGQVAGSQECCCENPPPPFCWQCADLCSYDMSVVEPEALPALGLLLCGEGNTDSKTRTTFMFPGILPEGFQDYPGVVDGSFYGGQWNGSRGEAWISPWPFGPYAFVQHWRRGNVDDAPVAEGCATSNDFELQGSVSVGIFCEPGRTPTPYTARVFANVSCGLFATSDEKSGSECGGVWRWFGWSVFDLNSGCITAPQRTCNDYRNQMRHLTTPVTITADAAGTSLGAYQNENTFTSGGMGSWCQGFGEALRDALTATFRITSRPSCRTITCQCDTLLRGLPLEFEGSGGAIGTEVEEWTSLGESEGFGRYAYGSGDQSWTIRHEKTDGFNLQVFNRRQLDIYCEQTVDGPVWRALIRTFCYEPNAVLEDVWMGRFLCYETVCEDLENNRPLNGPIPQEEPVEVEYLGRTYYGTFEPTCTPPPKPFVRLGQNTSC